MNNVHRTIGWCHYTWNPLTGCLNNCPYCYARKQAKRLAGQFGYHKADPFQPTFHPLRLDEPLKVKKASRIFVCSMGEIFDAPDLGKQIDQIIRIIKRCPQHRFLFLSRKPEYYGVFRWPDNCWLGTTITGQGQEQGFTEELVYGLDTFVSFEPLLGPLPPLYMKGIRWVIIGPLSNNGKVVQPDKDWVTSILAEADGWHIPVYMKPNLDWSPKRQEFPMTFCDGRKDGTKAVR